MSAARILTLLLILGFSLSLVLTWNGSLSGDAPSPLYVIGPIMLIVLVVALRRPRRIGLLALVMILAVTGYAYRFELDAVAERVLGALMPYRGEEVGQGSISFEAWRDGQFRIDAMVDGTPVMFLVDTGATNVVLTSQDARRLGYDPPDLHFSEAYRTANGSVRGAPIVLPEIVIGPIRLHDVAASVNRAPMPDSLLGVSFLDRLASYEVKNGVLTLTQ